MSEKNKSITITELAAELEILINNAILANPSIELGTSSLYDYESDLKYSSEILESHSWGNTMSNKTLMLVKFAAFMQLMALAVHIYRLM